MRPNSATNTTVAFAIAFVLFDAAAIGASNPSGTGFQATQAQVKKLKAAPGLEVTLFAAEPMVRNPSNLDVDARGRVWITEGVNYRLWQKWGRLRPEGDRIVILEDTDHDGAADKETTFYQGNDINTALGICVLGDQVIVSSSPNVFRFLDTNSDGKADKKEILFTGIKGADHDHGVHAFVFGPDGKLYFNFGNAGEELHSADGSLLRDKHGKAVVANGRPYRQGIAFRCNPDGTEVEVLGHNFRNPYELAVDSFGSVWQSDNDDDGNLGVRINYLLAHGNYGYADEVTGASWHEAWKAAKSKGIPDSAKVFYEWHQHDPGVVPNLLHTGAGSPTGICVYEGKLLPQVFQNQIFHCDAGPRVVRAYPVKDQGAGYSAAVADLITSDDEWFRPSDVCVAPDGALFVADWNDAGVGGHYMADQSLETMTGRIYRVAPAGHKASVSKIELSTASGAVSALQSPNQATRYLAWTRLAALKDAAQSELLKLWNGSEPRMRARALHLLARLPSIRKEHLDKAIADGDPDIRITALRIACSSPGEAPTYVQRLAQDPSPQVRREAALALFQRGDSEAPGLWATLAKQYDGRDRWYLEALGIGADQQWDRFLDAWLAQVGENWNTPAGRRIIWRSRGKKTPELLVRIIQDKSTTAQDREEFIRSFDFIQGPEKEAALIQLVTGAVAPAQ